MVGAQNLDSLLCPSSLKIVSQSPSYEVLSSTLHGRAAFELETCSAQQPDIAVLREQSIATGEMIKTVKASSSMRWLNGKYIQIHSNIDSIFNLICFYFILMKVDNQFLRRYFSTLLEGILSANKHGGK